MTRRHREYEQALEHELRTHTIIMFRDRIRAIFFHETDRVWMYVHPAIDEDTRTVVLKLDKLADRKEALTLARFLARKDGADGVQQ